MNIDEDDNPFADPSVQRVTAQTSSNQQALDDYNPFANKTAAVKPISSKHTNAAVASASSQQALSPISVPMPVTVLQETEKVGSNTTRVDLSHLERRQVELEQREQRVMERERELQNSHVTHHDNNFPPFPSWFPCRPCFYQNIVAEIPIEFQKWIRYLYYLWILYSGTLTLNVVAALCYFLVDAQGGSTFGLSIVYCVLFIPGSYICWFRPIYRAFRADRAADFMIFFFIFFFQICISCFMVLGWKSSGFCGFILMIKLFTHGGSGIGVGIIVMVVTLAFAIIAILDGLLLFKVHRLYRQSTASFEQAQREFQSAFMNNATVRGAASEVASASINQTLRGNTYQ